MTRYALRASTGQETNFGRLLSRENTSTHTILASYDPNVFGTRTTSKIFENFQKLDLPEYIFDHGSNGLASGATAHVSPHPGARSLATFASRNSENADRYAKSFRGGRVVDGRMAAGYALCISWRSEIPTLLVVVLDIKARPIVVHGFDFALLRGFLSLRSLLR